MDKMTAAELEELTEALGSRCRAYQLQYGDKADQIPEAKVCRSLYNRACFALRNK
jgi:hypothetical protein